MQSKTCHFLLPAGGAMTITEYGHLDLFRSGVLPNVKFVQIGHCMFKLVKSSHFLWPAGGALIIMEYSYLDVFRPGFLSNV